MRLARTVAVAALAVLAACERGGPLAPVTSGDAVSSAGGALIVAKGDTLYGLSRRYNVPLRDLIEANRLEAPYTIVPGQRLVLPASRQYVVQKGDTLYGISRMFGVDVSELTRINDIPPPYGVQAGQPLRLPGGPAAAQTAGAPPPVPPARRGAVESSALPPPPSAASVPPPSPAPVAAAAAEGAPAYQPGQEPKPLRLPSAAPAPAPSSPPPAAAPAPKPAPPPPPAEPRVAAAPTPPPAREAAPPPRSGARFLLPVRGRTISGFGPKPDGMHNDGINIAAAKGAPVIAADNGVVAYAGNELKGFGNLLLIRHDGGWITAYAHLDSMKVERGATVKRGQTIGTVGQTGSVSSPQLHFELRKGSQAVDPSGQMDGTASAVNKVRANG